MNGLRIGGKIMLHRSAKDSSQAMLFYDLQASDTKNRKFKGTYTTFCSACGKDFDFKGSDVKDQVIKCPYCKSDNIFFYYNYK